VDELITSAIIFFMKTTRSTKSLQNRVNALRAELSECQADPRSIARLMERSVKAALLEAECRLADAG
jgi:hypothetical protein